MTEKNIYDLSGGEVFSREIGRVRASLPKSFKIGRALELHRANMERSLFSQLKKKEKGGELKFVGVPRGVSLLTIKQLNFALAKLLYNTSYQYGRKDNTGLALEGRTTSGMTISPTEVNGKPYYSGEIVVKISELAAEAFGIDEPTNAQKKEIDQTLQAMQHIYVEIPLPDGKVRGEQLLNIPRYLIDDKTKAKMVDIILNPIYSMNILSGYGVHPQGIMKKLGGNGKRVTEAKLNLLSLLGIQDKRKIFRIYISDLLEKLGMTEEYKERKKRALAKLTETFQAMIDCGIISVMPTEIVGEAGEKMFEFRLSKRYIPKSGTSEEADESDIIIEEGEN